MKIAVIGSVAAGTSAAAKARRNMESAEIAIFEKDVDISYSACGIPYYISDMITDRKQLIPRDANFFKERYNIDVLIGHEVLKILPMRNCWKLKTLLPRRFSSILTIIGDRHRCKPLCATHQRCRCAKCLSDPYSGEQRQAKDVYQAIQACAGSDHRFGLHWHGNG